MKSLDYFERTAKSQKYIRGICSQKMLLPGTVISEFVGQVSLHSANCAAAVRPGDHGVAPLCARPEIRPRRDRVSCYRFPIERRNSCIVVGVKTRKKKRPRQLPRPFQKLRPPPDTKSVPLCAGWTKMSANDFKGVMCQKSRRLRLVEELCPDRARADLFQQIRVVFERRAHSDLLRTLVVRE